MKSPINRTTAPQIIRLLDLCFKQGVRDACEMEDDFTAKEWLEEKLADGGYGTLPEKDFEFDWRRWRYTLYRWCREYKLGSVSDVCIDRMDRYRNTMAFVLIPVSMRFYLMGVEEWLEYPNPNNMALFMQNKKTHWKPVSPHLKVMTTSDILSLVQGFSYEIQDKGFEKFIPRSRFDDFGRALWRCTQRYNVIDYGRGKKN